MSLHRDLDGLSTGANDVRTVLIVDDEPSMRTALTETVRRLGYQVRGAIDGADAVEQVERLKPWLVVTDLKMPRLNGLELVCCNGSILPRGQSCCPSHCQRYGNGYSGGLAASHLRPLFHDQRSRNRPGLGHRACLGRSPSRPHRCGEPSGAGNDLYHHTAARTRRRRRAAP